MKLNNEDKKKISEWINQKCGQLRCMCCGTGNWTLIDSATLPIGFDIHTTRFFYHQGIPQVAVVCNNCGHMVFFNTGIMGFRPDEPEKHEITQNDTDIKE